MYLKQWNPINLDINGPQKSCRINKVAILNGSLNIKKMTDGAFF